MASRDFLNFDMDRTAAAADKKTEMIEWAKENNIKARCLGVFVCQHSFQTQIRWLVSDDKEKTMFNLRWK